MRTQFVRYLVVGLMNAGLDFLILNSLSITFDVYAGVPIILFTAISSSVVIVHSYFWNKHWTFQTSGNQGVELPKFIAVNAGAFLINVSIVYLLTTFARPSEVGPLAWENIAKAVALSVVVLWNFTGFRYFVFSRPIVTD